jgi:hypothetical protein
VLVGRRTRPGDEEPVLSAFARRTGELRWELDRRDLGALVSDAGPQPVEVLQTDAEVALVVLGAVEDPDGAAGDGVAEPGVTAGDGAQVSPWTSPTARSAGPIRSRRVAGSTLRTLLPDGAWLAVADDDAVTVLHVDADGVQPIDGAAAGDTHLASLPDGRLLVASAAGIELSAGPSAGADGDSDGDDTAIVGAPFTGRDVVVDNGRVTLLLGGPDDGAVLVTFGA